MARQEGNETRNRVMVESGEWDTADPTADWLVPQREDHGVGEAIAWPECGQ